MDLKTPQTLANFLALIMTTQALNCNVCGYAESPLRPEAKLIMQDRSCALRSEPNSKFSKNCSGLEYFEVAFGIYVGVNGSGLSNMVKISTRSQVTYSCITFTKESELKELEGKHKWTARTCVAVVKNGTNETHIDKCYKGANSQPQILRKERWLRAIMVWLSVPDEKTEICRCFSDDCNGAESYDVVSGNAPRTTTAIHQCWSLFIIIQVTCQLIHTF